MKNFYVNSARTLDNAPTGHSCGSAKLLLKQFPYVDDQLNYEISVDGGCLLFNGKKVQEYVSDRPCHLMYNAYSTTFVVYHNSILTSFMFNDQKVLSIRDQQQFKGQLYSFYNSLFIAVPDVEVEHNDLKNFTETQEDENYLPASYNSTDADFEHFYELYGRRDTQYQTARLRQMKGIWFLEAEHLKDPFDCLILPREIVASNITDILTYQDDIIVNYLGASYWFVKQSGIWSLKSEYPYCLSVLGGSIVLNNQYQLSLGEVYESARIQDRKLVVGDSYPFYDVSAITGHCVACAQLGDSYIVLSGRQRSASVYKLVDNPEFEQLGAPAIAGFNGDTEQLQIDEQNKHSQEKLVDLEDIQDGYDINNEVDLFRNDFSQRCVQRQKLVLQEVLKLDFVPLGVIYKQFILGAADRQFVVFDAGTRQQFAVGGVAGWQISRGQLQITTESQIISPFCALEFDYLHFQHGISTQNLSAQLLYKNRQFGYYAKADFEDLKLLTECEQAMENDLYFAVVVNGTLQIYQKEGSDANQSLIVPIFCQLVESQCVLVEFSNYTVKLYSKLFQCVETRQVSILMRKHLVSLLQQQKYPEFMQLLPESRYSYCSFLLDCPRLQQYALQLTTDQLKDVFDLSVIPPTQPYQLYDAATDYSFYKQFVLEKFKLDVLWLQEVQPLGKDQLTLVHAAVLAGINFSQLRFPNNSFAQEVIIQSIIVHFRYLPDYQEVAVRFVDSVELTELLAQLTEDASSNAMNGVIAQPFQLQGGGFQEMVERYAAENVQSISQAKTLKMLDKGKRWYSEAVLRLFVLSKGDAEGTARLALEFPDFAVSQHLRGKCFELCSPRPQFKERDIDADIQRYRLHKGRANADFDEQNDQQLRKFAQQRVKYEEEKGAHLQQLERWEAENRDVLLVRRYEEQ